MSTDGGASPSTEALHPLVEAAARGELPNWARANPKRRAHMDRVAALLDEWAREAGLPERERTRWAALGHLHDALKEEDPEALRALVPPELRDLPDPVLHGPAVAERLRREGVADDDLLRALAYHTLGHPSLDRAGRALYAADFLEPGRELRDDWRSELRERMPDDLEPVVAEIVRARLMHLLEQRRPARRETLDFWNAMAEGAPWARASEL